MFPASRFVGLDLAPDAIALAEAERAAMRLGDAEFVIGDAAQMAEAPRYDVITAFDSVHDQRAPGRARRIHDALVPGGVFVMVDGNYSGRLENNIGNPYAPMGYGDQPAVLPTDVPGRRVAAG